MARTKQTARKSTDPAKRPRKQLATKERLQMYADRLTIWTNQIHCHFQARVLFEDQTKAARRGNFAQVARRVKITSKKSPHGKNFKVHIYKVLLSVHPGATISVKAMTMMNSLILHAFEKIAAEASKLANCNKKSGWFSKLKWTSDWMRRQQIRKTFWKPD